MELIRSKYIDDWALASNMLMDVVTWLDHQGTSLWEPKQVSIEGLTNTYKRSELYFISNEDERIGLVFLQESDPFFWPEIKTNDTLYIHKLCLLAEFKGQGLGSRILLLIQKVAKDMGKEWLRLDCDDRPSLHRFYKDHGFQLVDFHSMENFVVARYQLKCR